MKRTLRLLLVKRPIRPIRHQLCLDISRTTRASLPSVPNTAGVSSDGLSIKSRDGFQNLRDTSKEQDTPLYSFSRSARHHVSIGQIRTLDFDHSVYPGRKVPIYQPTQTLQLCIIYFLHQKKRLFWPVVICLVDPHLYSHTLAPFQH